MEETVTGTIVVEKMAMLILLILIGYFCARMGWIDSEFSRRSSKIVLNVFTVAMILNAALSGERTMGNRQLLFFFGMALVAFALFAGIGTLFPHLLGYGGKELGVAKASILFMNNVFIGFPVIEALFGSSAVFCASLTNIPFNVLLYSVGISQLCGGEEGGHRILFRRMLSAPLVATLLAVVLFLVHPPLPALVTDTLSTLGGATVPMSMLIIGTSLSEISLKKALTDGRVYGLSLACLVLCPLAVWGVLHFFVADPLMLGVLVVIASCPSATMLTILSVQYGADDTLASKTIFVSTLLSAATIPLMTWLLL